LWGLLGGWCLTTLATLATFSTFARPAQAKQQQNRTNRTCVSFQFIFMSNAERDGCVTDIVYGLKELKIRQLLFLFGGSKIQNNGGAKKKKKRICGMWILRTNDYS
jgi:hypothetical protein